MNHYELLGVAPRASTKVIRRAYLDAARRAHPDIVGPEGDDPMRELNQAWRVLSDPDLRKRYDKALRDAPRGSGTATARPTTNAQPRTSAEPTTNAQPFINRPAESVFVPHTGYGDDDDDDDWRYTEDETDPETAAPKVLQFLPLLIFALAIVVGGLGLLLDASALIAVAAVIAALGFVSFLLAPLFVMGRASSAERRRQ